MDEIGGSLVNRGSRGNFSEIPIMSFTLGGQARLVAACDIFFFWWGSNPNPLPFPVSPKSLSSFSRQVFG